MEQATSQSESVGPVTLVKISESGTEIHILLVTDVDSKVEFDTFVSN